MSAREPKQYRLRLASGIFGGIRLSAVIVTAGLVWCLTASMAMADPGLGQALSAWQQGDLRTAESELTTAIDGGSVDPRLWYLRGVITEQSGGDGMVDFQKAAALEVAHSSTRTVNQALEKVQGPIRGKIEAARESARAEVTSDPQAARTAIMYRDAVAMLNRGDLDQALVWFDNAIAAGSRDARVQYLRGVALARQGNSEAAKAAFQAGLSMETSYDQVLLVNSALQNIQGDVRQMIEEQVQLGAGDAVVTRQTNQRMLMAEHEHLQRQLLAGDSEQHRQLLAQAEASRRAKEEAAAQRILEEEQRQAATDALIKAAEADLGTPEPLVASPLTVVPETPIPGASGAIAAATPPAANPFLVGGGSGGATSGTPLDTSWLAPNSELVFYARPADILNSRFLAPVLNTPDVQQKLQEITAQQGLPIEQIESVTGGMGDLMARIVGLTMGGAGDPTAALGQFMNNPSAISVVRMSQDFDFSTVASEKGFASQSYADRTYFVIPVPEMPANVNIEIPASAVCQIDARTLLSGTEPALQAALDRGPGQSAMAQFGFLSASSHLTFGFSNPGLAAMSGGIPTPQQAPPMVQEFVEAIKGQVTGFALAFTISADLKLEIKLALNNPSATTTALRPLQATLQMAQQMYPLAKQGGVPPELHPPLDSAVGSLQASRAGNVLNVSLTVPGQLVTVLMNNPHLMQPSFGPGGGGVPGGFPAEDPSQGFRPAAPGGVPAAPGAPAANPSQGFGFPPGQSSPAPQN